VCCVCCVCVCGVWVCVVCVVQCAEACPVLKLDSWAVADLLPAPCLYEVPRYDWGTGAVQKQEKVDEEAALAAAAAAPFARCARYPRWAPRRVWVWRWCDGGW
jgi:hypothetical protein